MNSELRMQLQIARTGQFNDIVRTALFALAAITAIIGFGAKGVDLVLVIMIVTVVVFGAIGASAALEDVEKLRDDMDEATGGSTYGQHAKSRNLKLLRALTAGLLSLIGIALIIAVFWN